MNQFLIKPKLQFGGQALSCLAQLKAQRVLLVTDQAMLKLGMAEQVIAPLQQQGIEVQVYADIASDPDIRTVVNGMKVMDDAYPDTLIALGGGSVIDAAKAIMFTLWQARGDSQRSKPYFVAIPTTSGTGSEMTSFAVIKSGSEKWVLVDEFMLPDLAILDPALVQSVPATITADTGMDVLCHALEAYVSRQASDFTDALAEQAVKLVFGYLLTCYQDGQQLLAREKIHNASSIAGMAFTNAGLGITHSLAHALGGVFGIPHGRANAMLLPYVVAFNADLSGECDNHSAKKYAELARLLGLPCATVRQGVESLIVAIQVLKSEMAMVASIMAAGVNVTEFEQRLPELVAQAQQDACTPSNPRMAEADEMIRIYLHAFRGGAIPACHSFKHANR